MLSTFEILAANTLGFFLSGWASGQWILFCTLPLTSGSSEELFVTVVLSVGLLPAVISRMSFPGSEIVRKTKSTQEAAALQRCSLAVRPNISKESQQIHPFWYVGLFALACSFCHVLLDQTRIRCCALVEFIWVYVLIQG